MISIKEVKSSVLVMQESGSNRDVTFHDFLKNSIAVPSFFLFPGHNFNQQKVSYEWAHFPL